MEARRSGTAGRVGTGIVLVAAVAIAAATLTASDGPGGSTGSDGLCLLACGSRGLADVLANVILFLPLGVGLGLLDGRVGRAALIAMGMSIAIELAQLVLIHGRDSNPSDVFSNTAGAALGVLLVRWWISPVARAREPSRRSLLTVAAVPVAVLAITGLLLRPALPPGQYMTEWQSGSDRYAAYRGEILGAGLGDRSLLAHGQALSGEPGTRLGAGEALVVTLRKAAEPPGLKHVLSLEQAGRDILFLGIDGDDVRLHYETWATRFRLDSPSVRLQDALADVAVGDTVSLLVQRSGRGYCVEARQRRACPLDTLASGWRLIHNLEPISEWALSRMNSAWLFLLAMPLGLRVRRDAFSMLVIGAVGLCGLVLPTLLSTAPLSGLEWLSGTLGLAVGWFLGAWRRLPLTWAYVNADE